MAIAPNLLAQMLRANPFGGETPRGFQTQQPFAVPGTRGEEADFLTGEAMAPLNAEQAMLADQLRQAQAMGEPQQVRTMNPWAAGLGALANILRASNSRNQQGLVNAQLRDIAQRRQELTDKAGRAPSRAGLEQTRLEQQQGFQTERERLGRDFQAGEAERQREFERAQLGRRLGAERQQAATKAEADKAARMQKTETDLRDRLLSLPETKAVQEIVSARRNIAGASPTGAGDMRLLYSYLKILDPGSTVREGEFATAGRSGGLPGQIQGYFNMLTAQGILPDAVRRQVKEEGAALADERIQGFGAVRKSFRGLAEQYGVDPGRVDIDLGIEASPTRQAPAQAPRAAPPQRQQPTPSDGGVVGARDSRNVVRTETDPVTGGTLYFYADGRVELEE